MMTYTCNKCGAVNKIVNLCGCDPNNLPTKALAVTREHHEEQHGTRTLFSEDWTGPRYKYGYINRPFAMAHQPKGFLISSYLPLERVEIDGKRSRHGTIEYPFQLTDYEVYSYEMFLIPEAL